MSNSQSHVFRKWTGGSTTIQCWGSLEKVDTALLDGIDDELKKDSSKAATSVPSPFARMFLFKTAFEIVARQLKAKKFDATSIYAQLVSDTLDLLEAIFLYGDDFSYVVYNWDEARKTILDSAMKKKDVYVDAIDFAFAHKAFAKSEITLIYYKNKLVGGTSPFTLLFTSPNWYYVVNQDIGNNEVLKLESKNGDVFFDNDFKELTARGDDFVEYLVKLYAINKRKIQGNDFINDGFGKVINQYIEDNPKLATIADTYKVTMTSDETSDETEISNPLLSDYNPVKVDGSHSLKSNTIQLFKVKEQDIVNSIATNSDFVIRFNPAIFLKDSTTKIPLVLVSGMNDEGDYLEKGTGWNSATKINKIQTELPVSARTLPNSKIQYPFVTVDDFLEDTLIKTPYSINSQRFFTKATGDFKFLLPIKKAYFEYFSFEDLNNQLTIKVDSSSVSVQLSVPIKNRKGVQAISFEKTYSISKDSLEAKVGLGIFPFYKVTSAETLLHKLNDYTILLADGNKGNAFKDLTFWQFSKVRRGNPEDVVNRKGLSPRSTKADVFANSLYYKVPTDFDFIEVEMEDSAGKNVTGIIIPLFERRNLDSNTSYSFAVDFGTSNSHIAFNHSDDSSPQAFQTNENDMQMVLLHRPDSSNSSASSKYVEGHGGLTFIPQIVDREFVPSLINSSNETFYSFPIRTVTCEKAVLSSTEPALFEEINIGFYVDYDNPQTTFKYQSNLKWLLETRKDDYDKGRVMAFIEELLLLIRNKVILNNGDITRTQIAWLVPQSMSSNQIEKYEEIWNTLFERTFKGCGARLLPQISESLAPYYYLTKNEVRDSEDTVNIDIGGGTTDVMFFMQKTGKYLSTSFKFAGSDIWGDGIKEDKKDNGFIKNLLVNNKDVIEKSGKKSLLDSFMSNATYKSEDVISLLFKYNDLYKFTDSIKLKQPELRLIFFLHYSAIIYHLVQVIEANKLNIPRYFTFTGKGSQYLKLMCSDSNLLKFTKYLLSAYSSLETPKVFKTLLIDNPKEATANGAVLYITSNATDQISTDDIGKPYIHIGNKNDDSGFNVSSKTFIDEVISNKVIVDSVIGNVKDFVTKTLTDPDIEEFLITDFEIKNLDIYKDYLLNGHEEDGGGIEDSFSGCFKKLSARKKEKVSETLFFLGLKDSLYGLSKFIVSQK